MQGGRQLLVYVTDSNSTAATLTDTTDTNVTGDVRHVRRVRAINGVGLSHRSNCVNPVPSEWRQTDQGQDGRNRNGSPRTFVQPQAVIRETKGRGPHRAGPGYSRLLESHKGVLTMFRFAGKKLPSSQEKDEDRATAAVLACGGTDGVPAFVLRHRRPGGGSTEPVFITWLLGVGRFCLTVKYGRYSLRGAAWRLDTGRGLRAAPSPLDQARFEALQVSEVLRRRLNRRVPVSPALALFDTGRDRRIERIARQGGVTLLWDLERCTGRLADAATDAPFRQSLERRQALEEISALVEDSAAAGVAPSRAPGRRAQSAPGS